jgi:hypothetical protein
MSKPSFCKRLALGSILVGSTLMVGSCGDEYSYFTVNMNFELTNTTLSNIGTCSLKIESGGKTVDSFTLGQVDENGTKWGCAQNQTRSYIGKMNYSALRKSGDVLKFILTAKTDEANNSTDVAQGWSEATANPGTQIVVGVKAVACPPKDGCPLK